MALEREGLLDRSDPRRPCLTEAGRARVAYYAGSYTPLTLPTSARV